MQRALTIKILAIALLALVMLIPLKMIQSKISERDLYRIAATNSIAQSWTGSQTLMTPVLVIPYTYVEKKKSNTSAGWQTTENLVSRYRFIPTEQIRVSGSVVTNTLMRGIYKIPVYESELTLNGRFSKDTLGKALKQINELERRETELKPFLALHISDARGISKIPTLNWNSYAIDFEPGSDMPKIPEGIHANIPAFDPSSNPEKDMEFSLTLSLRGMENLSFIPAGDLVDISLQSEWPHPEFVGAFLPETRKVNNKGFTANWQVTKFASNIGAKLRRCEKGDCLTIGMNSLGVNLIDPVDVYLQSERSIKYGILFIGLSFISFFLFENLKKMRIHPIQYGLVGLSIATFYLLLISLSEHIHFGLSYMIATLACVALIFSYLKFVLAGIKNSMWFSGALIVLYGILYIIIQAEDFALLMGAVLVFGMLSIVMIVTRHIDWYQIGEQMSRQDTKQGQMET